jgi:hypothetical protein
MLMLMLMVRLRCSVVTAGLSLSKLCLHRSGTELRIELDGQRPLLLSVVERTSDHHVSRGRNLPKVKKGG